MSTAQDMIRRRIRPGQTIVVAGERGEGKTHLAISLAQGAVEGRLGLDTPAELITNVVFGRRLEGSKYPVESYPDGVHHEDTFAGTLRRTGEIMADYGFGNVTIIWILDEAQNFMLSDLNFTKENLGLKTFLGTARKFCMCNMFLTPAINNLTPRIRCFASGDEHSGYCTLQIQKNARAASRISYGDDPRSVSFYREQAKGEWQPVKIASGSWARNVYGPDVQPNEYAYDTGSTATLEMGENAAGVPFDLRDFMRATSAGMSHELPMKVAEYFATWDDAGSTDGGATAAEYPTMTSNDVQAIGYILAMRDGTTAAELAGRENVTPKTIYNRVQRLEERITRIQTAGGVCNV